MRLHNGFLDTGDLLLDITGLTGSTATAISCETPQASGDCVQEKLRRDPHGGQLFVFRGRHGQRVSLCIPLSESGHPDELIILILLVEAWPLSITRCTAMRTASEVSASTGNRDRGEPERPCENSTAEDRKAVDWRRPRCWGRRTRRRVSRLRLLPCEPAAPCSQR
jgi:hypothetical protein